MPWQEETVTTIVLPTGATSGQRIVLDATAGTITLYAADETIVFKVAVNGLNRFLTSYPNYPSIFISGFDGVGNPVVNPEISWFYNALVAGTIAVGDFFHNATNYPNTMEMSATDDILLHPGGVLHILSDGVGGTPTFDDPFGRHDLIHQGNLTAEAEADGFFTKDKLISIEQAGIAVAPLGTGRVDITTTANVNCAVASELWASGFMDVDVTVAGNTNALGELSVDGVIQAAVAVKDVNAVDRLTPGMTWVVPLAVGAHTIKMTARKQAALGTCNIGANTRLAGLIVPT